MLSLSFIYKEKAYSINKNTITIIKFHNRGKIPYQTFMRKGGTISPQTIYGMESICYTEIKTDGEHPNNFRLADESHSSYTLYLGQTVRAKDHKKTNNEEHSNRM